MSKEKLYRKPQYQAQHPEDGIQSAVNSGAAAAGSLAADHNPPANFPQNNIYSSKDLRELYKQENLIVALYRRINRMIKGR